MFSSRCFAQKEVAQCLQLNLLATSQPSWEHCSDTIGQRAGAEPTSPWSQQLLNRGSARLPSFRFRQCAPTLLVGSQWRCSWSLMKSQRRFRRGCRWTPAVCSSGLVSGVRIRVNLHTVRETWCVPCYLAVRCGRGLPYLTCIHHSYQFSTLVPDASPTAS